MQVPLKLASFIPGHFALAVPVPVIASLAGGRQAQTADLLAVKELEGKTGVTSALIPPIFLQLCPSKSWQ